MPPRTSDTPPPEGHLVKIRRWLPAFNRPTLARLGWAPPGFTPGAAAPAPSASPPPPAAPATVAVAHTDAAPAAAALAPAAPAAPAPAAPKAKALNHSFQLQSTGWYCGP